tara:strand:+ start:353 stop:859 length:507 start_codon:yes stop_codon:yes gene_type:complete
MKLNLPLLKLSNSELIILTFIVTGLWDVVLRIMNENWEILPSFIKNLLPFIKYLDLYFEKHTLLAAALIAAFVGATTQPIIYSITPFPKNLGDINYVILFLINSFIISALYGFIMKGSKLFPILEETYYKKLEEQGGVIRSMYHDGISGLIVQFTIFAILLIYKMIQK